ncbi:cell division control 2 [Actinidia rufa]|uniref:cyclin-dependent kinase n=1 Tax=Actinidia rufa TaxID=165716 RepID=A0A7J0DNK7_9ERIC|nr:cell division control 2 [Actinidia rufa]
MERYIVVDTLAPGSQAEILKATDNVTNKTVILKKYILAEDNKIPHCFIREASLLYDLDHQNIVRLLHVLIHQNSLVLVLEHMPTDLGDDMLYRVKSKFCLGCVTATRVEYYIETSSRSNVLVDTSTNTVKIADFGLARGLFTPSCSLSPEVGSLTYQAPEILLGSPKYSSPVDMWSVGCIFGEMLLLRPLFPGSSKSMVLKEIFRLLGTPTEKTWPGVSILPWFPEVTVEAQPAEFEDVIGDLDAAGADLIRRLLYLNPKGRITAEEALKHDYFAV